MAQPAGSPRRSVMPKQTGHSAEGDPMTAPRIKDYDTEPSIVDRSDSEPRIKALSRECAAAIDKLTAIVAQVEDRLEVVRFRGPVDDYDKGEQMSKPGASPL